MKKKAVDRRIEYLRRQHRFLRERFMDPISHIGAWDTDSCYSVCSFVLLLHSELERAVEHSISDVTAHAERCSATHGAHPTLVNVVAFFRGEVAQKLPELLPLVPARRSLEHDPQKLLAAWHTGGAKVWFESRLERNHGTGTAYMANMLHPIGLEVAAKEFRRTSEARGVKRLGVVRATGAEELGSLVRLRGAIAHGGFMTASGVIASRSWVDISSTADHSVEAVAEAADALLRCW